MLRSKSANAVAIAAPRAASGFAAGAFAADAIDVAAVAAGVPFAVGVAAATGEAVAAGVEDAERRVVDALRDECGDAREVDRDVELCAAIVGQGGQTVVWAAGTNVVGTRLR
jgi:hypothetical protein